VSAQDFAVAGSPMIMDAEKALSASREQRDRALLPEIDYNFNDSRCLECPGRSSGLDPDWRDQIISDACQPGSQARGSHNPAMYRPDGGHEKKTCPETAR
jgi:hypothetical protein